MPKIEIELTGREYEDLEEMVKEGKAKNVADALKEVGFKTYHMLKRETDKKRKKPALEFQYIFPKYWPCAFVETIKEHGYKHPMEFISKAIEEQIKRLELKEG